MVQSFNVDDYIDEYSEQAHMNGYSTRELGDDLEDIDKALSKLDMMFVNAYRNSKKGE